MISACRVKAGLAGCGKCLVNRGPYLLGAVGWVTGAPELGHGGIADQVGDVLLQRPLTARVACVQFNSLEVGHFAAQLRRSGLAEAWPAVDQHRLLLPSRLARCNITDSNYSPTFFRRLLVAATVVMPVFQPVEKLVGTALGPCHVSTTQQIGPHRAAQ